MEGDVLRSVLNAESIRESLFSDGFLHKLPLVELKTVLGDLHEKIGAVLDIESQGQGQFLVSTKTHRIDFRMNLDDKSRISGLHFRSPRRKGVKLEDVAKQLIAQKGQVALLVTRDGETLFEHQADAELAVGSAFKLGVLDELNQLISGGARRWSDVVLLQQHHISLPSGILHKMRVGSPLTLHSLAALMISVSDNTATDALIDVIGRDALQRSLGPDNLLTTRELFLLKSNDELRQRYLALALEDKPSFLHSLQDRSPNPNSTVPPHQLGLEWYVSARNLCSLMQNVKHLDVMSIEHGPARKEDWQHMAFKGGSEEGVLNLTTGLTDKEGRQTCVVLTINADIPISRRRNHDLFTELLESLVAVA